MHHGLANTVTGIVVGGLFGTIFGTARYVQLKYTGSTYEENRTQRMREKLILKEYKCLKIVSFRICL